MFKNIAIRLLTCTYGTKMLSEILDIVREHFPQVRTGSARVYRDSRAFEGYHYKFYGPDGFYAYVSAETGFLAFCAGWEKWLNSKGITLHRSRDGAIGWKKQS
jgi:hypothetical protein